VKFIGRVIDVNDPEKAGRVKIRIYGMHDNEVSIPDADLPWARCVFPVTNPVSKGVAGPTTGLVVGSVVVGYFADEARQIPLVEGSLGRSTENETDFPKADRGEDYNEVLKDTVFNIGTAELKHLSSKTIGNISYAGQQVTDMLADIGEGNIGAAISQARNALSAVKRLKTIISNSPIENLNMVIEGFKSDLGSIVTNQVEDLLQGDVGQIISAGGTIADVASDIAGTVPGTKLLTQINKATGVTFTNAASSLSSIGQRVSKTIGNPADALNRLGGHKFVMNNTMKGLESSLNSLKSVAKVKKTASELGQLNNQLQQAKGLFKDAQNSLGDAKSLYDQAQSVFKDAKSLSTDPLSTIQGLIDV
jgi:hypothetical protein